ncbi:hypothetical protein [Sphingomonas sp. LM7]|uniref:hypothetical protein n=1 Tax=Sphingomonas sp. LM7 TaxID=1938607 RepID=UPI000983FB79|nr:hypothetical protein [Sphingomonas sp. LM7]AQR75189.1 hypothetical protein BXU08_17330 [Sphingomonas sp. LM7]
MWEYDDRHFRSGDLHEEPAIARFVSGLVSGGPGRIDIHRSVISRYPLEALPLIEWNLSEDVPALFETLKSGGATNGFFLDYPDHAATGLFHACDLTPEVAALVRDEDLFGSAIVFVDDLILSAVAAWYTDITVLCMRQPLFDAYLTEYPLYLDLEGDPAELPASSFEAALAAATKRLADWSSFMPPGAGVSPAPPPHR